MKFLIIIIFLIIFFNNRLTSQIVNFDITTQLSSPTGLSDLKNFSLTNPATLESIESGYFAATYMPSKFGLKELSQSTILVSQRITNKLVTGLGINGIVNDLFSDYSANLCLSTKFNDNLDLGASVVFNRIAIKDFSSYSSIFFNLGARIKLTDDIYSGFSLSNILRENRFGGNENVVQTANISFGSNIFNDFYLECGALISISKYSGLVVGIKYNLEKYLSMRLAASTAENAFEFAALIKANKNLEISSSLTYQTALGFSPNIGINIPW